MPSLADRQGEALRLEDYFPEFDRYFWSTGEFWKLERGQTFAEPGDDSWEAFDRGEWNQSMQLLESRRAELLELHRSIAAAGQHTKRVRIVHLPITDYLRWELELLVLRDETGGPIRILLDTDHAVEEWESLNGPLPEVYTFDDVAMMEAIYDDNGVLDHAVVYLDQPSVVEGRELIRSLWGRAEPIRAFYDREIAHLPPSPGTRTSLTTEYLEGKGDSPIPRT